MTSKNEMGQSADSAEDKVDVDNVIKHNETKSTGNSKPVKKSGLLAKMLVTVFLAFAVVAVYAYFYMPDTFNQYLSFSDKTKSTSEQELPGDTANQDYVPSSADENHANNYQLQQQSDWVAQQRAEFEKRRAEFQKRLAESYAQQWQPATPSEPPQWVKDRQAEMENQRQQYMKEMSEQQARWSNAQSYNQTAMNPYQQPVQQQMPYGQYQGNNAYQQPQYNRPAPMYHPAFYPAYSNGPYGRPYPYYGNGYR